MNTGRMHIEHLFEGTVIAPERREVEVVCIRPGLSRNGNFYGPECLKEGVRLFEGARAYIDHADTTLRSVRDLAGSYKDAQVGPGGEIRATLKVSSAQPWLWAMIQESVTEGSSLVALSVDISAQTRQGEMNGRPCRIVEKLDKLHSCDVITRASAGGSLEKLLEADKQSWWDQYEPANEEAANLAAQSLHIGIPAQDQQYPVQAGVINPIQFGPEVASRIAGGQIQLGGSYVTIGDNGHAPATGQPPSTTALSAPPAQLNNPSQLSGLPGTVGTTIREGESPSAEVNRILEELRAERAQAASERLVESRLRDAGLPAPSLTRLRRGMANRVLTEAQITQELTDEREYLAGLVDSGLIRGMGFERGPHISTGLTEGERLQKAFDQLFDLQEGEKVPALSGIREAYVAATRDLEISGVTDPARLREADVTTSTFSYLLGTSMNKRLLKDYQAWPSEWQKFCTITPIKDFKAQDRIRLGAFGSLSTVAEDGPYTTITLSDTKASYTPAKKGNLVAVTRETIVNDDLYAIKQIPGKLAVAAAFTLAEFVYTLLGANGAAIYDTFKLFDSINHLNTAIITANLGTPNSGAALATAALQTAVTKMRRQTNLAAKPIGLKPRFILVAPELEFAAMVITKSAGAPGNNFNDINPMLGYAEVIVAPQIASSTYWTAIADPRVIDTIEVGFVGGQMNPQLFIQDQPLFGNNFTNDTITYKVRHEYGGAVVDYRGFYLGNN